MSDTPRTLRPLVAVARSADAIRREREDNADALRVVASEIEAMSEWLQTVWDVCPDECDDETLSRAEDVAMALRTALAPYARDIIAHERGVRAAAAKRGLPYSTSVTLFGTTLAGRAL